MGEFASALLLYGCFNTANIQHDLTHIASNLGKRHSTIDSINAMIRSKED